MAEKQKKVRKYIVGKATSKTMRKASLDTISGLYEHFLNYKQTERMSPRTMKDYQSHFHYLMKFLEVEDISRKEMTKDLFREYISWMLYEQDEY
jgi:integrase/recombinase XerD